MRGTKPEPGIPARWATICARCKDDVNKGDRVVYRRGAYIHVRCCSGQDEQ